MTIPVDDGRNQVTATGGETTVAFNFKLLDEAHLVVMRTRSGADATLTLAIDYTVPPGGIGVDAGGTITLISGAAVAGDVYTLERLVPRSRASDYSEGGDYLASVINNNLDRIIQMIQEVERDANRGIKLQDTDETDGDLMALPIVSLRASKYLAFDASGVPVATSGTEASLVTSTYIETLLDDANAAAAQETLGLGVAPQATFTAYPPGFINGLVCSINATDSSHDVDISVGSCRNSADDANVTLSLALTKQMDVTWAEGDNAGGLGPGASLGTVSLHVFLITEDADPTNVDVYGDSAVAGANVPTGWTIQRRIGTLTLDASNNLNYVLAVEMAGGAVYYEHGNKAFHETDTNPGTGVQTVNMEVPAGIRSIIIGMIELAAVTTQPLYCIVYSGLQPVTPTPSSTNFTVASFSDTVRSIQEFRVVSGDSTATIKYRLNASGAADVVSIATVGWIDPRTQ